MWLEIDPHSGNKIHEISSEGIISSVCPVPETQPGSVFLARTGAYVIECTFTNIYECIGLCR